MPRVCCYCPGCKSGYTSDIKRRKINGEKLPCLFSAPKDPNLFESWKKVIPRGDRELRPTDALCSLHFKEEDINTHYEQKLTDGTIWRAPRGKASLKKGSIPSIFPNLSNNLSPVNKKRKLTTTKNNVKEKSESATYSSQDKQSDIVGDNMKSCFVAGCKTGYKSDINRLKKAGMRIPSVFSTPKDPALFNLWQRAIPRSDRKLSPKDVVCELHFKEEDIDTGSELKLFDGTIYRHEKLRKGLKPGVIPTIFSNVPGHSSYNKDQGKITKRKAKCKRKRRTKKLINKTISPTKIEEIAFSSCSVDQTINEDSVSDAQLVDENAALFSVPKSTQTTEEEFVVKNSNNFLQSFIDMLTKYPESTHAFAVSGKESPKKHFAVKPEQSEGEQFSFNFVKMNLHVIKKENSWWTVNDFENFIICARWNSDYITERKIVISDDLSYKVFIKEKEIKMWNNKIKLTSLKNISRIIYEVEYIEICKGIDLKNSNCYGFIQSGIVISRKKNLCINCIRTQNQYVKAGKGLLEEEEIDCPEHVELLRVHFRY